MIARAKGILSHCFFGEYSAVIALAFISEPDALAALDKLGEGWRLGEKRPNILVWSGNSKELEACKDLLGNYGADKEKIDSVRTSIDYGEPFEVSVIVKNKDQLNLF